RATVLDGVVMRPERVSRVIPAGKHPDLLTFAITSNFQLLIAAVYAGLAARALELGAAGLHKRKSAKSGTSFAEVPEARARLAEDRKSTRLNSSHVSISYAVFCLKKKRRRPNARR